jgi:hypothetical protein
MRARRPRIKDALLRGVFLLGLAGCTGVSRDCSSWSAGAMGADWVVAQYRYDGTVLRCWRLPGTSIGNEQGSDGIFWQSPEGHLVHLSGWYNRVQVEGGGWDSAAASIGVALKECSR